MSSIYLSTISSPPLTGAAQINKVPAVFPFSVGNIHVGIVEKAGPTRFLFTIKNQSFLADSDLSLEAGDKLLVKVEQLQPQIVLRVINREASSFSLINDYLKLYMANPDALMDIFIRSSSVFNQNLPKELLSGSLKESISNILKIIDSLIFSQETAQYSIFIKNYAANLGLLLEYGLLKMLQERREPGKQGAPEGLKGALIRLSEELQPLIKDGRPMGQEDAQKLTQLLKFVESSLKAIETRQMINIISQENNDRYALQIPLLFPDGIRMGEIFIETGEKGKGGEREKNSYRIAVFLSMDALGDMMADMTLKGARIACLFKFEDHEAENFFTSFLSELEDALHLLGYDCEYLTCITDKSLSKAWEECRRDLLYNQDIINLFA
jgi:hypothetical protein